MQVLRTKARGSGSAVNGRASACALAGVTMCRGRLGMLCDPGAGLVWPRPPAQDCTFALQFSFFPTAPLKVLIGAIQRSHLSPGLHGMKASSVLVEAAHPAPGTWQRWARKKWVLSSCPGACGQSPGGNRPIWAVFTLNPGALMVLFLLLFVPLPVVNSLLILQDPAVIMVLIKPFSWKSVGSKVCKMERRGRVGGLVNSADLNLWEGPAG